MISTLIFSFTGQNHNDSIAAIPVENIKVANRIYLSNAKTMATLLELDSLQAKQITHLHIMLSLCNRQMGINEGIIMNQNNQIGEYKNLVKKYKIRNRITIAIAAVPITYLILKNR